MTEAVASSADRGDPRVRSGSPARTGAIVLAAGASTRMGRPKALVPLAGRPLLEHVLRSLRESTVAETVVVLGFGADAVRRGVDLEGLHVVENRAFAEGMSSSLRAGLEALPPSVGSFYVVLGDAPFVHSSTYGELVRARERAGARIAIPTFHGVRGNPVLMDRSLAPEVEQLVGDRGCRAIHLRHPSETVEVAVDDPGVLIDLDTPEEVARAEPAATDPTRQATLAAELGRRGPAGDAPRTGPRPRVRGRTDALARVAELERRREPFVLATVVQVHAPTSGKPGFKAVVYADGRIDGWVGGSCSRHALKTESRAALEDGEPRLLRLRAGTDACPPPAPGVVDRVMECQSGGAMEIYLEPHGPPAQLLIVGDSPVAECLASLGRLLGYRVVVAGLELDAGRFPDADEIVSDLAQLPAKVDAATYAVVATMAQYDGAALRALAPSPAPYVGLVASRRRAGLLFEELRGAGVAETAVARIQNPAGVDIHAKTPEEIALSVAAEITQRRRAAVPPTGAAAGTRPPAATPRVAVDPVCHMEVDPASTPLHAEHQGVLYWFCSEHCLDRFARAPADFLT